MVFKSVMPSTRLFKSELSYTCTLLVNFGDLITKIYQSQIALILVVREGDADAVFVSYLQHRCQPDCNAACDIVHEASGSAKPWKIPIFGLVSVSCIPSNHPDLLHLLLLSLPPPPLLQPASYPQDVADPGGCSDYILGSYSWIMPISGDEWDHDRIDFRSRLRPAIMEILNETQKAYAASEILDIMDQPDEDLTDALKSTLGTLAKDRQWIELWGKRQTILENVLKELCNNGEIECKEMGQETDSQEIYYIADPKQQ